MNPYSPSHHERQLSRPASRFSLTPDAGLALTQENDLYRAIIFKAFEDACVQDWTETGGDSKTRQETEAAREEARVWLRGNTRDFFDVCLGADFEPFAVRQAAHRMAKAGWPPLKVDDGTQAKAEVATV